MRILYSYQALPSGKSATPKLLNYEAVTFAGSLGEPLMNQDFPEMIAWLKKQNPSIKINVLTNGLTLNNKIFDRIRQVIFVL